MESETGDEEFLAILAKALEQEESNERIDVEKLCRDRPDWTPRLRRMLERGERLGEFHQSIRGYDPQEGARITERFVLQERVGSGGMGVVYRAWDEELKRHVAVKMLRPEIVPDGEESARLMREAEVLASLSHPALLMIHDRGILEDGRTYLVMDFLEGMNGSEVIEHIRACRADGLAAREEMDHLCSAFADEAVFESNYGRQAVRWMSTLARGLELAHRKGAIHRDIKPSNVFIRRDGTPVLIDFGIVTIDSDQTLARKDGPLGTPAYMAPEQVDPNKPATPATDVYALGATLYSLLSQQRPYAGTPQQVLAALQRKDPKRLRAYFKGLPKDLEAILDKAMSRNPRRRYETAAAFAEDLDAWLDLEPVRARPLSWFGRALRRTSRSRIMRGVAGTLVALLLIACTWLFLESRKHARLARFGQAFSKVSPLVILRGARFRVILDPELRQHAERNFDLLVENGSGPWPSQVFRAGFYMDHGRGAEAAREFMSIARHHDSSVSREVAQRSRELTTPGTCIELDDLPEPRTDFDHLLLAFLALRAQDYGSARDHLESCTEDHTGRELLRLVAQVHLKAKRSFTEHRKYWNSIHRQALEIEGSWQRPVALARYVTGEALSELGRHGEAAQAFDTMTELTPWDMGAWISSGYSWRKLPDLVRARTRYEQAASLAPHSAKVQALIAEVEAMEGNVDAALSLMDGLPAPRSEQEALFQARCRGATHYRIARRFIREKNMERGELHAKRALAFFSESHGGSLKQWDWETLLCAFLIKKDLNHLLLAMKILAADPLNAERLYLIARTLDVQAEAHPLIKGIQSLLIANSRALQEGLLPTISRDVP